jgi:hypothetical protein
MYGNIKGEILIFDKSYTAFEKSEENPNTIYTDNHFFGTLNCIYIMYNSLDNLLKDNKFQRFIDETLEIKNQNIKILKY